MTEEQKEILIAKMLDAPASLSDMELDAILNDDELRDIYAASAALDSAYAAEAEFDMDAEWKRFCPLCTVNLTRCVGLCEWLPFS